MQVAVKDQNVTRYIFSTFIQLAISRSGLMLGQHRKCVSMLNYRTLRFHHTNSFAHSSFFKFVTLCSSLGGTYYRYIILLPIRIDSVMICCSKSSEISKDMVAGSPCATSNWALLKTALIFFARSRRGEWARGYYGPNKKYVSFECLFYLFIYLFKHIYTG